MATPLPQNQARFGVEEIAEICRGRVLGGDRESFVTGVATDSREELSGKLFVALRGERYDGHGFASVAAGQGAHALLVERDVDGPCAIPRVVVDDTLRALGDLGQARRRQSVARVIAVAGSAGKTTTKSAIATLLSELFPGQVHAVRGNLNNRVGLPRVLLALPTDARYAVVELGTNCPGEIAELSRQCEANVGVLTLVDLEHSEGLGDLDAIEAEEAALFQALPSSAIALGNGDDPRVSRRLDACAAGTKLRYGTGEACDYRILERRPRGLSGSTLVLGRPSGGPLTLQTGLIGLPGALAAAAAVAVVEAVSGEIFDAASYSRGLSSADVGESGRLRPVELSDGTLVLDDTYNANPASVLAAVTTAEELARERNAPLWLVLGEMRELGDFSLAEHRRVGALLRDTSARGLVAVAGDAAEMLAPARHEGFDTEFAATAEAALPLVRARVRPGDVVLVKASRGVGAEFIVQGLVAEPGRTE